MNESNKAKWYFNPWVIMVAILCFGPLGLLPLWLRPKTRLSVKLVVSVAVIAATVVLTVSTINVLNMVMKSYQQLAELCN